MSELTPEARADVCRDVHRWAMRHARFYRQSDLKGKRDNWLLQMQFAAEARRNLARWKSTNEGGT